MQANNYPSRTFAYPFFIRLFFVFGFLFFGWLVLVSQMNGENSRVAFVFIVFMIFFIYLLYRLSSKFEVNNTEIRQKVFLRKEKILRWTDISSIKGSTFEDSLKLCDARSVCITIDPYLKDFDEFVYLIRNACPNLWNAHETDSFSRSPWLTVIGLIFAAMLIIPAVRGLVQQTQVLAGIALLGLGVLFLVQIMKMPQKVIIEGETLQIKYLTGRRYIHAGEIYDIQGQESPVPVLKLKSSVIIILSNGRKIELAGFSSGTPVMEKVLRLWWQQKVASTASSLRAHPK